MLTLLTAAVTLSAAAPVAAQSAERAWAELFGDGMRSWAEGRYDEALTHLYRAYALQPSPRTMRFIIRSHDFMGHCSAAEGQIAVLREEFPTAQVPALQVCHDPATLHLRCERPATEIRINANITSACGRSIRLPGGEYHVSVPELDYNQDVTLANGQERTLVLTLRPRKWTRAGRAPEVPRLLGDAERFTVFLSRDGLYQVWVRDDGGELLEPYGASICRQRADGRRHCKPLTKEQREGLQRLVPRIEGD